MNTKCIFLRRGIFVILIWITGLHLHSQAPTNPPFSMPNDWAQLQTGFYPLVKNNYAEKPGWSLVFFDEFNGSGGLDPIKWNLGQGTWGSVTYSNPGDINIAYRSGGTLKLLTKYTPGATYVDPTTGPCTRDVYSAIFRSNSVTFGPNKYYEIRCKIPKGPRFHQGFWTFSDYAPNYWSEVDFYENGSCWADGLKQIGTNYHTGYSNPGCTTSVCPANITITNPQFTYSCEPNRGGECVSGHGISGQTGSPLSNPDLFANMDLSQEFYTIGVEWQNNEIRWYLNHRLIRRTTIDIPQIPGNIWVGVAVDQYWPETLASVQQGLSDMNNQGLFPGVYEIDYIRVYEKECGIEWPLNNFAVYSAGATSNNEYPRLMGDVDGDGDDDIVYFESPNVKVSLANGSGGYSAPITSVDFYTVAQGFSNQEVKPRFLEDVNGDGKKDIIGFSSTNVYVSLARTTPSFAFNAPYIVLTDFCISQGWTDQYYSTRKMADINGDGKKDIVGFGWNLMTSLATTSNATVTASTVPTFGTIQTIVTTNFTVSGGWTDDRVQPRLMGDINGDGNEDIVGFGSSATYAAIATPSGFGTVTNIISDYTTAQGWNNQNERPRFLADVNGDGMKDIVAFGYQKVQGNLSTSSPGSTTPSIQAVSSTFVNNFSVEDGWTTISEFPRYVEDVNCDGKADIIGFGYTDVLVAYSKFTNVNPLYGNTYVTFDSPIDVMFKYFSRWDGWSSQNTFPRFLANVDGNGTKDMIGFGYTSINTWRCFPCVGGGNERLLEEHNLAGTENDGESITESRGNEDLYHLTNYPNPFTGSTTISVYIPQFNQSAKIMVCDMLGRELTSYVLAKGNNLLQYQGFNSPGILFYSLYVDGQLIITKRMIQN